MFADNRSLILAATPTQPSQLRTIFSDNPEGLKRKLESPPAIRERGWSLRTVDRAKLVRGELIRVESHRFVVDLYRDGTLLFVGHIYSEFLAWSDRSDVAIHPLAMIEVITSFTRFYASVIDDFRATPEQILFSTTLRNLHLENKQNVLPSGPVGNDQFWGMARRHPAAPSNNWRSADLVVPAESFDPDHVAYLLIREIYFWFGHSDEDIPYLKAQGDSWTIDADQIAAIDRRAR